MIKEAIDRILGLARVQEITINNRNYTDKGIVPVMDPSPAPLQVETLTGMIDYINANRDNVPLGESIIHIENHAQASLRFRLGGEFVQRDTYITAKYRQEAVAFGRYIDLETAIIWLQSNFLDAGHRASILSLLGNISDGIVTTYGDDGISQSVTAKKGITKVESVVVPNPVTLTPYRTFIEAEQPASNFVFRMRSGGNEDRPSVALFEADGGKWKSDAIINVKKYIEGRLVEINQNIPVIA